MFEPRTYEPTDQDLVELLATRGMGWHLHNSSGHRPGTRDIPHAWRWNRDRVRIMVFVGGHGTAANVEFDPLNCPGSAAELVKRLAARNVDVSGWDVGMPQGRRAMCEEAAKRLTTPPPVEPDPKPEPLQPEDEQVNHGG